ncbi:MAG: ATP-binding protein [Pseudomonadota bacterium]|nr:ATP-binding protein [Pseudomonadota bacterium]
MAEPLKFKPYARLLTMLGDQLIKNERVALVEIIKNSYDADATWVTVKFMHFGANFEVLPTSSIVIEDNGIGMTETIIRNHWVNPATPVKLLKKQKAATTDRGRVIQGEKGIGRFALLKLGRNVAITTRPSGSKDELLLKLNLSAYDDDFLHIVDGEKVPLFLDDLNLTLSHVEPPVAIVAREMSIGTRTIETDPHGTRIEISDLRTKWSEDKVVAVYKDLMRLQTIFDLPKEEGAVVESQDQGDSFEVAMYRDQVYQSFAQEARSRLDGLIQNNAALKIEKGHFDADTNTFTFEQDGFPKSIKLSDAEMRGLAVFRRHYGKEGEKLNRKLECGSFGFSFYAFDFSADAKGKYALSDEDRKLIREHRIYLYRDGIRVYPYGDPTDDWLGIDIYRGTIRASEFLSNDQVLGYVTITQADNPELRDKTSREGLIDVGNASDDFRAALQVFLAWVRRDPYEQYRRQATVRTKHEMVNKNQVVDALNDAWEQAKQSAPAELQEKLAKAATLYKIERDQLTRRAETTEHLAGVGLSVETASHDLMVAMGRTLQVIDNLLLETEKPGTLDKRMINRELTMVRGSLSFIETQLKDIQQLFQSTKQRKKDIRVADTLDKVVRLFVPALKRNRIDLDFDKTPQPLVAKTTEAVLLQVFLNLFDNAVYWLQGKDGPRNILIRLNGEEGSLTFADDGPGIRDDDAPYIFDPFFTGKGEEGRGLGLYIARQLLQRHDYDIELVTSSGDKLLRGANFKISFIQEDRS